MFKTVAEWLKQEGKATPETDKTDELAALVTALMVEAAQADGHLSGEEEGLILRAIIRQFELTEESAQQIMADAVDKSETRVELHSLLRRLRENSDYEERLGVIELVWMVVHSDGTLDHIEAQLMRRLAGLLFVSDVDSGLAAKAAKSKLGLV